MNHNVLLAFAWLLTGMIAVSTAAFGYTALHWWRAAREQEIHTRTLAWALFVDHCLFFVIVGVRLVLTLLAWLRYDGREITAGFSFWQSLVSWLLITTAALISVGIATGRFSPPGPPDSS